MLVACQSRTPRLPLVDSDRAAQLMPDGFDQNADPPHWARLLANFPGVGRERIAGILAARTAGSLDPVLRAKMAWVAARQDRAWYAIGQARNRLRELGLTDDEIFALDGELSELPVADRLAQAFAAKLTTDPALISDGDVATLREHFSDHQVAELIAQVTEAAFFDRMTEAAGLPLE